MTSSSRPASTMTARTASRGAAHGGPRRDPGEVPHLAPRPGLAFAVEMHAGVPQLPGAPPPSSPSRFTISASECRAPSPSGQPQIARTCCSNWSIRQAASVQWPGVMHPRRDLVHHQPAPGHEQLDPDHPDIVERGQDPPGDQHRVLRHRRPAPPPAPASGAGCRRDARSRPDRRPRPRRRARAPRSPRSRARSRRSLREPTAPRRPPSRPRRPRRRRRAAPGPCRRSRGAGSSGSPAPPSAASAAASASGPSTARYGAVARPSPRRKSFSAIRSCATSSARRPGRTGTSGATASIAASGTFSNS